MLRRAAFALPLALVLGCGAAPPPAAAPPPEASVTPSGSGVAGGTQSAVLAQGSKPDEAKPQPSASPDSPPPAPGRAGVATEAPLTTAITQDDVLALVQKNAELFNRCYTLGAGASKSYRAKVSVKATVGPTGTVNAVEVTTSTAKNPKVDACVVDAFKKLTFARAKGSGTTTFTFPMSFDGLEQVQ